MSVEKGRIKTRTDAGYGGNDESEVGEKHEFYAWDVNDA